jgi:S-(hydroxymethyl)glutathione dehydrogenase/alcohol dehydrogenase
MTQERDSARVSRRSLLAAGGGATAVLASAAQAAAATAPGPRRRVAEPAKRFKAYVRQGATAGVREVTLDPLSPRSVLIRTEACQCCYSITGQALGRGAPLEMARILGHGGVGVVEAVGSAVRRVKVGQRVIVPNTPQCGECYNCLNGRADLCFFKGGTAKFDVIGKLEDGSPVVQHNNTGGCGEYMVPYEEFVVAIDSKHDAAELSMLSCVAGCGLGTVTNLAPVSIGAFVAVLGCGCVGLSALQGAKILGARKIIAIEPIKARRDLAMQMGADIALDPNVERDGLVARVKDLCRGSMSNKFAGMRWTEDWATSQNDQVGVDYAIDASGGDQFPPKAERGPDPTGLTALRQAWEMTAEGGHVMTPAVFQQGNVSFPASQFANSSKTIHSSSYGGSQPKRDMPRYVGLIEQGRFDAKSMVTLRTPLERGREAFQAVADRTTIGAVLVF